jgi:hypothetical protein
MTARLFGGDSAQPYPVENACKPQTGPKRTRHNGGRERTTSMKIRYSTKPITLGDVDPKQWLVGEVVNGGVQKPNGKYLSVQPDGSYQERDAVGGPYEQIRPSDTHALLIVRPRVATYEIPYVEL